MSNRRAWLLGGGALVIIGGTASYLWFEGLFLPEPEITIPELPPIKLSAPPATATAPAPATSLAIVPATPTGTSAATAASPTHSVVMVPGSSAAPATTGEEAQPPAPAAPSPDTRVAELEAIFRPRLESLQTQCEAQLNELADQALADFARLGKTSSAKATVAAKYAPLGRRLQSTCERHYDSLITSLETELRMNGLPLTMLNEVKTYYAKRVQEMKAILLKKAGI